MKKRILLIAFSLIATIGFSQTYDKIYAEYCGLRSVDKDGKVGFIDKNNKLVIPLMYDGTYGFNSTYKIAGVSKNKRRGYINLKNEVVIPLEHDYIKKVNSTGLVIVQNNEKYGLYNYKGVLVQKIEFDLLKKSKEKGLVYFEIDGKSGYLDKTGKMPASTNKNVTSKTGYDQTYKEVNGYRKVKKAGKIGFIDKSGKVIIPLEYDGALNFNQKHKLFGVIKNKKAGFVNEKNVAVVPLKYDWISEISHNDYFKAKLNDKYGFVSPSNQVIVPVKYDKLEWYNKTFDMTIAKLNGKNGILDGKGKEVLAFNYDNIEKKRTYNSKTKELTYFFVVKKGDKYAVYDRKKGLITGFDYIFITAAQPDQSKKWTEVVGFKSQYTVGIIDNKGGFTKVRHDATSVTLAYKKEMDKRNKVIKEKSDKIKSDKQMALASAKYTKFQKDGKWGFKNAQGKVVIKAIYSEVSDFNPRGSLKNKSYSIVKHLGKYGIINKEGVVILKYGFDAISKPVDNICILKDGSMYGYLNIGSEKVKFLTGQRFTKAAEYSRDYYNTVSGQDLIPVEVNKKKGFINKKGKEIIPAIFDEIGKFDKYGYAVVKLTAKDRSSQRKAYGIIHCSGDQKKGIKMVLSHAFVSGDGYIFNTNSDGKQGSVKSHGNGRLASKTKFLSGSQDFSDHIGFNKNYTVVYNNTTETRFVHFKNYENQRSVTSYKLQPGEVNFFPCESWRSIYVSESGNELKTKKAIDTEYSSACGTIVKVGDFYPSLDNSSYSRLGF
jgi:hypothetical protein